MKILFIFGTLLTCEAEILHFLYLEDFPTEDLPDERCFSDGNEVAINFHFDDAVYSLDLYFLDGKRGTFLKLRLLEVRSTFLHP